MEIVNLQVNLPMHTEFYEVGKVPCAITQRTEYRDDLVITQIKNTTMEFEDSLHTSYEIYANGQLYRCIEYTPVTVEYKGVNA